MKDVREISKYLENKWYELLNYFLIKKETTGDIRIAFNQMKIKVLYIKMCGMQLKQSVEKNLWY